MDPHRIGTSQITNENEREIVRCASPARNPSIHALNTQVLDAYAEELNKSGLFKEKVGVKLMMGSDVLESFLIKGLWDEADIDKILGQHGVVVTERAGVNTRKLIDESPILSKYKVCSFEKK